MALFRKSKKKKAVTGPPMDVAWVRSPKGLYYNFLNLEPEDHDLAGKTGVFVIWLGGHWPEWLYIGRAYDLDYTLTELQRDPKILQYDKEAGLFVTWSEIKSEFQDGVVQYLNQVIPPTLENPNPPEEDEPPIAVFPPRHSGAADGWGLANPSRPPLESFWLILIQSDRGHLGLE